MCTKFERQRTVSVVDTILKEIFEQIFSVSEFNEKDSIETIALWDSMGHMELMVAIEQRFGIRIAPEDVINLTSVSMLREYLKDRL
jgi:acyl carrier protein